MAMKDEIRGPKDIFGSHHVVQPDLPRRLFFLNTAPVQHTGKQNAEISAPANAKPDDHEDDSHDVTSNKN